MEDKRLERLYDYTKFHIGIYLSAAGGVAALLASKEADWAISRLIGNPLLAYSALVLMVLAGVSGGIVATGTTESLTFQEFWTSRHHPKLIPLRIATATGEAWATREHGFFWSSLLVLALAILVRNPWPFDIVGAVVAKCDLFL